MFENFEKASKQKHPCHGYLYKKNYCQAQLFTIGILQSYFYVGLLQPIDGTYKGISNEAVLGPNLPQCEPKLNLGGGWICMAKATNLTLPTAHLGVVSNNADNLFNTPHNAHSIIIFLPSTTLAWRYHHHHHHAWY